MPTATAPHERVTVGIPVGCGRMDRRFDLFPGLEPPSLECERLEDLPPGLDPIQIPAYVG